MTLLVGESLIKQLSMTLLGKKTQIFFPHKENASIHKTVSQPI